MGTIKHIYRGNFQTLLLLVLLLTLGAVGFAQPQPIKDLQPTVILISLDGFRYDYLQKYDPVVLNQLAREGVRARWLTPSFPSKTFPNHYTIATGLYPQNHGIVENNVYVPEFNATFMMSNRDEVQNGRWWLGEPIWITAEKQGQKAAPLFWPGSEAKIGGLAATYWQPYDSKITNDARVDKALAWLDLPRAERPTFLTLYFSDVDDAGHNAGPDSVQTRDAVHKVDQAIGRLVAGLKAREIFPQVNLIIVADHGMAVQDYHHAIMLDELFDVNLAEKILWTGEIVSIFPKAGQEQTIYQTLKAKLPPQAKVYRKRELPARLHYSTGPRVAPLLVLPAEGWILTNQKRYQEAKEKGDLTHLKGGHGYDNQLPSMRAIFIAHGAAFKHGRVVAPFANIHIYNIMTRILGLRPAPNDGNYTAANAVLATRRARSR